jgi:hypothetical protein
MSKNRLIFGTASLGSRTSYQEFIKVAHLAYSKGINTFDTSTIYGRGLSQKYLAKFIEDNEDYQIRVISKFGRVIHLDIKTLFIYILRFEISPLFSKLINNNVNFSLSKSNINNSINIIRKYFDDSCIDTLLLHSPEEDSLTNIQLDLISEKLNQKINLGCSDPSQQDYINLVNYFKNSNFTVQTSYDSFLQKNYYQKHDGKLILNGIFRHSLKNNISLEEIFLSIDKIRNQKMTFFNFGFYSCDFFYHIYNSYNKYIEKYRLYKSI